MKPELSVSEIARGGGGGSRSKGTPHAYITKAPMDNIYVCGVVRMFPELHQLSLLVSPRTELRIEGLEKPRLKASVARREYMWSIPICESYYGKVYVDIYMRAEGSYFGEKQGMAYQNAHILNISPGG